MTDQTSQMVATYWDGKETDSGSRVLVSAGQLTLLAAR